VPVFVAPALLPVMVFRD